MNFMFRYLRIATTVLCLVASVLLLAMWMRSYWRMDQLIRRISTVEYVACTSIQGAIVMGKSDDSALQSFFQQRWTSRGLALKDWDAALTGSVAYFPCNKPRESELVRVPRFSRQPFVVAPGTTYNELTLPYWLLVLSTASLTALLIRPRFQLRTLIIAISLFALLFGLAAISR